MPLTQADGLGTAVPEDDVRLLILNIPRLDDKQVAGADAGFTFHLPRDPGKAGFTIFTNNVNAAATHKAVCDGKHFFLVTTWKWKPDVFFAFATFTGATVGALMTEFFLLHTIPKAPVRWKSLGKL